MNRFMKKWSLLSWAAALALLVSLIGSGTAFAQTGGTVVATGLMSPRGVTVGPDGSVYVAEAGSGGPMTVTEGETSARLGFTGQVSKVAPDGSKSVVAGGLPSVIGGEEGAGLHDLVYANGALWGVVGTVSEGKLNLPGEDALLRIDPSTGMSQTVASFYPYEAQHNPGGFAVDSNASGLTLGPDGMVYVADAGANTIYRVNPADGALAPVAVIPGIPVPAAMAPPGGNPERGGANELDPVPTGVAFGPDGNLYVSLLSGGPFPPGAAKVLQVTMDGKVSDAAPGLTMLTDIKLGPDGAWYVVEFGRFDLQSNPPGFAPNSGDIVRLSPNGQRAVVVSGLAFPNKMAFDASGNLYVTTNSLDTANGQLMRVDNATSLAGTAPPGMPTTGSATDGILPALLALLALTLIGAGVVLRRKPISQI
jgi:sugar lactone lactonase YvrE